jgi:hypothetical protein
MALDRLYNFAFGSETTGASLTAEKNDFRVVSAIYRRRGDLGPFAAERFIRSIRTQKTLDQTLNEQSNDVHLIAID